MDKHLEDALDAKMLEELKAKYAPYLNPSKQTLECMKFLEEEYTKQRIKGLYVLDEEHNCKIVSPL